MDVDALDVDAMDVGALDVDGLDVDGFDVDAMDVDAMGVDAWGAELRAGGGAAPRAPHDGAPVAQGGGRQEKIAEARRPTMERR